MSGTNTRNVNVVFRVDTGTSKEEVENVRKAVEDFGDEGKQSAQKIVDSIERNVTTFAKFERAVEEGSPRQQKEWQKLALQVEGYRATLIATFGTLDKAPAQAVAELTKMQTRFESATVTVRKNKDALAEMKTELQEGGEKWTSLGDAVNKSLGPLGAVQAKIALVGAAFSEGWQIGQRLNTLFGTDMSLWEESTARFGQKANLVIRDLADQAVAAWNVLQGIIHGSPTEIKNALKDMSDAQKKFGDDLSAALTKYDTDWDKYATSVGLATKGTAALAAATQAAAEKKLELKKAADAAAAALKAETEEIEKQQKKLVSSTNQIAENTAMTGAYEIALRQATAQLEAQKRVVDTLTHTFGENDLQTLQAIDVQKQMQATVDDLTAKLNGASAALKQGEEQHKAAAAAILVHKASAADLAKHQTDLMSKIAAVSASTATATTGQAAATLEVYKYTDAHGKLVAMVTNVAKAEEAVAASAEKQGVAIKASSGEIIGWTDAAGHMNITQQKTNQTIAEATAAQERHAEAIRKTREAMDDATKSAEQLAAATAKINSAADEGT